jgi:hypothetical protein
MSIAVARDIRQSKRGNNILGVKSGGKYCRYPDQLTIEFHGELSFKGFREG